MKDFLRSKNFSDRNRPKKKRITLFDNLNLTRRIRNKNIISNDQTLEDFHKTNHNSSRIEYPSPKYNTKNVFQDTIKISNVNEKKHTEKNLFKIQNNEKKNIVVTSQYPYFKGNES